MKLYTMQHFETDYSFTIVSLRFIHVACINGSFIVGYYPVSCTILALFRLIEGYSDAFHVFAIVNML